jgi:hypothetical protein
MTAGARGANNRDRKYTIVDAWRANNRATSYLVENLPADVWCVPLPDSPRKTIRSIAAHLHNSSHF